MASFAVDPGSRLKKGAFFVSDYSADRWASTVVAGTNLMANTGVDGELMQQGMEMAVARNGGKQGHYCCC